MRGIFGFRAATFLISFRGFLGFLKVNQRNSVQKLGFMSKVRTIDSFFGKPMLSNPGHVSKKKKSSEVENIPQNRINGCEAVFEVNAHDKIPESGDIPDDFDWSAFAEIERSWLDILEKERNKKYFAGLKNFVQAEYKTQKIFPPQEQIFSALNACNFHDVRVVILGQDPYHGPGQVKLNIFFQDHLDT